MNMGLPDPIANRRILLHLLGAAGLAFPGVANAKLYDKMDKLLKIDDLDQFNTDSADSLFFNDAWADDFQPLFSNLRNFQKGVGKLPDVQETKNGYEIRVEAPGVKKEDLKVELVGKRSLVVSASSSTSAEKAGQDDPKSTRQESSSFRLWNQVAIPLDADTSRIKLKYDNGLLIVGIPRFGAVQAAEKSEQNAKSDSNKEVTARADPKAETERELEERMAKIQQLMQDLESEKKSALVAKQKLERAKRERAQERIQLELD